MDLDLLVESESDSDGEADGEGRAAGDRGDRDGTDNAGGGGKYTSKFIFGGKYEHHLRSQAGGTATTTRSSPTTTPGARAPTQRTRSPTPAPRRTSR